MTCGFSGPEKSNPLALIVQGEGPLAVFGASGSMRLAPRSIFIVVFLAIADAAVAGRNNASGTRSRGRCRSASAWARQAILRSRARSNGLRGDGGGGISTSTASPSAIRYAHNDCFASCMIDMACLWKLGKFWKIYVRESEGTRLPTFNPPVPGPPGQRISCSPPRARALAVSRIVRRHCQARARRPVGQRSVIGPTGSRPARYALGGRLARISYGPAAIGHAPVRRADAKLRGNFET